MKRYSEMSAEELNKEIERLDKDWRELQKSGLNSQAAIAERKSYMAKSYLIKPESIIPGKSYEVEGESGIFKVDYLNGVMAWGTLTGSSEQISFAIAMLKRAL